MGPVTEDGTLTTREEEEEQQEDEEEQARTEKEDLILRGADGTTSRERLTGMTARAGGTTRP